MTEILVRLFVKDNTNVENPKVRTSYGTLSSIVGIICNVLLSAVKLVIGIIINSISVQADAVNNISDAASSIISLIGVKLAGRPADKEHPFGHGRFEYLAGLVVAFLILQVGFTLLKSSFNKILTPQELDFNPLLFGFLCLTVLLKFWMMLFNRKLGKRINSTVMLATSADSRNDVIVTSATIISNLIFGLTALNIDGYIGLLVSLFVMFSGFNIAKDTLEPLIGQAAERDVYDRITDMVESYEGIVGSHDLIIHNYGPTHRMATIHAEVPNDIDFQKAHETIDLIERDILTKLDVFLVIHMDPIEVNDVMVLEKKEMVNGIINRLEPRSTTHDFRIVNGEHQVNLIFDLVVPYSYSKEEEQRLLKKIIDEIRRQDARYNCVITLDKSFVAEQ